MGNKQDIEEEKSSEAKKQALEALSHDLQELLQDLESEDGKMREGALDPISKYKLGGESGSDWLGANFTKAEENKQTIATNMSNYAGEIANLESEIQGAIKELEEAIASCDEEE